MNEPAPTGECADDICNGVIAAFKAGWTPEQLRKWISEKLNAAIKELEIERNPNCDGSLAFHLGNVAAELNDYKEKLKDANEQCEESRLLLVASRKKLEEARGLLNKWRKWYADEHETAKLIDAFLAKTQ